MILAACLLPYNKTLVQTSIEQKSSKIHTMKEMCQLQIQKKSIVVSLVSVPKPHQLFSMKIFCLV